MSNHQEIVSMIFQHRIASESQETRDNCLLWGAQTRAARQTKCCLTYFVHEVSCACVLTLRRLCRSRRATAHLQRRSVMCHSCRQGCALSSVHSTTAASCLHAQMTVSVWGVESEEAAAVLHEFDAKGINTNPKGGNRLWRTR